MAGIEPRTSNKPYKTFRQRQARRHELSRLNPLKQFLTYRSKA
jgi:hypothetical protein